MKNWLVIVLLCAVSTVWAADAAQSRLSEYTKTAKQPFSAERGKAFWTQSHSHNSGVKQRSCASCHGEDVSKSGKHASTGKLIKPLSRNTNPVSLSDEKNIEKWFTRNCKWTLDRECSALEKGDVLTFLLTGVEK